MMKKSFLMALLLSSATYALADLVNIQTKKMTLVVEVNNGKHPSYIYFGSRLSEADLSHFQWPRGGMMDVYPAYGQNAPKEAAFAMRHVDGNMSTELVATGVEKASEPTATVTTIHLKDPQYPINVDVKYRAYNDVDMIETWTEIVNNEKGTVTLTSFASGCLPIRRGDRKSTV